VWLEGLPNDAGKGMKVGAAAIDLATKLGLLDKGGQP